MVVSLEAQPPAAPAAISPGRRAGRLLAAHWGKLLAGTLALAGVANLTVRSALGPLVPVATVTRAPLVQKVVASGRVRGPARIDLGSVTLAKVLRVNVEEGQAVRAGDVLVELDAAEAEAQVAQAKAQLDAAEGRLAQIRRVLARTTGEGLRQAEIALDRAEKSLSRTRSLATTGAISAEALEQAEQAVALAKSQREAAATQAESASAGGSDFRVSMATVSQARAAVLAAEARLAQMKIVAPADGVLLSRSVEPGSVVSPGARLLVLGKAGPVQLVTQPDEKSLAFVRVGQPALASADAFPSKTFAARVATIAPSVDAARGTVEVKLEASAPPAGLLPDMTVSVSIEVDRRPAALSLPAEAVRDPGKPWVLALRGGRAERREVELGVSGEGTVEIAAGLAEGEQVILPGAEIIEPGRKVRPRPAAR